MYTDTTLDTAEPLQWWLRIDRYTPSIAGSGYERWQGAPCVANKSPFDFAKEPVK